ncbi:MAG: hypothetical protein ACI4L7_04070 [Christensenellales bacterium]
MQLAPMVCNSVAMDTECEKGRRFIIFPNVPEKELVGIKIPPKTPITLIKIEDILTYILVLLYKLSKDLI